MSGLLPFLLSGFFTLVALGFSTGDSTVALRRSAKSHPARLSL